MADFISRIEKQSQREAFAEIAGAAVFPFFISGLGQKNCMNGSILDAVNWNWRNLIGGFYFTD